MKILTVLCALAVSVYFVLLTYFVEHGNLLKEFFAAVSGFAVLVLAIVSFILGLVFYKYRKFSAFIPCLICLLGLLAGFVGAIGVGESIKATNFKKSLPRYNEVVSLIDRGEIERDSDGQIQLPEQFADLAYSVFTHTNSDGRTIIFVTDHAFPLYETAYIYTSSGVTNKFIKGRNCIERVDTNWFYVSD
jgi:hypothetical protein